MKLGMQVIVTAACLSAGSVAFATPQNCDAAGNSVHTLGSSSVGTGSRTPNPADAVLGTTPADIHARFAGVVEQNFRTGDPNKIVHALTSRELADLAALYNGAGGSTTLLRLIATKADAPALALVASAFGQTATAAAVEAYAPANVRALFTTLPTQAAVEPSPRVGSFFEGQHAGGMGPDVAGGPTLDAPNLDMTPYEVYLEFRTAPFGTGGVMSALYEAGNYMSGPVGKAAIAGYSIGTAIHMVIEAYAPSLDDAIGGTVANMLEQIHNAQNDIAAGKLEQSVDDLFGKPIAYNDAGDFDVNQEAVDYFEESGGC